jgi:hypothetical protein
MEASMDRKEMMRFKMDDPHCPVSIPRWHLLSNNLEPRARSSEKSGTRIAEALSLPLSLEGQTQKNIDELAAWVVRLEYGIKMKEVACSGRAGVTRREATD